jgi:hypothetical protein
MVSVRVAAPDGANRCRMVGPRGEGDLEGFRVFRVFRVLAAPDGADVCQQLEGGRGGLAGGTMGSGGC